MKIDLSGRNAEIAGWRQHIHQHPEMAFKEVDTSAFVVERLRGFGFEEIDVGLGTTGVVATLRAGTSGKSIGLRADMDALPLTEQTGAPYASTRPGVMHACGHDGHTAMLLGAAQYLAATRRFDGTVHFIFQPAEEALGYEGDDGHRNGGARAMLRDGLFERFPMDAIFGMHNRPGLPAGMLGGRPGVIYAAADRFEIEVTGKGGHAARPHLAIDPIFVASQIVVALQGVVSRIINPLNAGVLSICEFHSGSACNIIPEKALLGGTVRTLDEETQDRIEESMEAIVTQVASAYGATAALRYERGHPAVVNDPDIYAQVREIGRAFVGPDRFVDLDEPTMGGEDFSNYLKLKPGCFLLIGNGDVDRGSVMLHNPRYDFNDDVAHLGAAFWSTLVEKMLPVSG